jgi:phage regulator Rha-like protein
MRNSTIGASALGKDAPGKDMAARLSTKSTTSGIQQLDSSGADLALTMTTTGARIDSRLLAAHMGNGHKAVMSLLDRYLGAFRTHGQLTFQKEVGDRRQGGGNAERYALLNEDQAYFLLSLSRNNEIVVALKSKLITAFSEARRATDMRQREYLPTYHHLQDVIHTKAAGSVNQRHVHINVAKLLNKTVGLEAGQRASASVPQQALLIVAQLVAARAMEGALDHHDGYQRVKQSMLALSTCTMLGA